MIRFLHAECLAPPEIHRLLVMYGAHTVSRKQAWTWCNSFDSCRIDAEDKQRRSHQRRSVKDANVYRANAFVRQDRCTVTSTAEELDISPGSAHNMEVSGGAFGWGTALQGGGSRVRFPMMSLEFFIDITIPAALWPWD
jgi:hypothetical protein